MNFQCFTMFFFKKGGCQQVAQWDYSVCRDVTHRHVFEKGCETRDGYSHDHQLDQVMLREESVVEKSAC